MITDSSDMQSPGAKIKVIGIGGGGTNAVSTMIKERIEGVDFISVNTDLQSLKTALAPTKIQIGKELTKGLGAGSDPSVGRDAALEDRHEVQEALSGADMVFITAGMGGGTGTGGASIVSQIAKEMGALTVAVVTKPFLFEGKRRRTHAEIGIERLRESVDTLIVIPNERLLEIATPELSLIGAFKLADNVLVNAVKGISDIINIPGTINVDFADVKAVMSCKGQALMGIGFASGKNRAVEAANQAISSPLLDDIDIEGASGILINITAGENVSLLEVNEACTIIQESAHEDANIIFGAVIDPNLTDEIRVTVIATGFSKDDDKKEQPRISQSAYMQTDVYKLSGGSRFGTHDRRKLIEVERELQTYTGVSEIQTNSKISQQSESILSTAHQAAHDSVDTSKVKTISSDSWDSDFDSMSQNPEKIKEELDRKIDEALDLADRIMQDEKDDSLDIPTFLRKNDSPSL